MDYVLLGNNIRKYRKLRGYTQEKLSELVNISSVFMSQIENATRKPSIDTVVKIASTLNISIDLLVNNTITNSNNEISDFIDCELTREQKNIISFAFKKRSQKQIASIFKAFAYLLDFKE